MPTFDDSGRNEHANSSAGECVENRIPFRRRHLAVHQPDGVFPEHGLQRRESVLRRRQSRNAAFFNERADPIRLASGFNR